jgi:lipoic acid synthetase
LNPECKVEVLIPDFNGDEDALNNVLRARPDVLNHNTETIARLYRRVRPDAIYEQSMELLTRAAHWRDTEQPTMLTKSGIMAGLGETFRRSRRPDARSAKGFVRHHDDRTVSPALRKTLPVERYVTPEEFAEWKAIGESMGFKHVESSPLTRSSYHASSRLTIALTLPTKENEFFR